MTTTHKTLRGPRGGLILANKEAAEKYNFNKAIFPGIQGGPLMHSASHSRCSKTDTACDERGLRIIGNRIFVACNMSLVHQLLDSLACEQTGISRSFQAAQTTI